MRRFAEGDSSILFFLAFWHLLPPAAPLQPAGGENRGGRGAPRPVSPTLCIPSRHPEHLLIGTRPGRMQGRDYARLASPGCSGSHCPEPKQEDLEILVVGGWGWGVTQNFSKREGALSPSMGIPPGSVPLASCQENGVPVPSRLLRAAHA